jgi:hypothetical protein
LRKCTCTYKTHTLPIFMCLFGISNLHIVHTCTPYSTCTFTCTLLIFKMTAFLLLFSTVIPKNKLNFIIYQDFFSGNWMWQYTSINNFMLKKCNHDNSFIVDKIFNRIAAMRLESWKISINRNRTKSKTCLHIDELLH